MIWSARWAVTIAALVLIADSVWAQGGGGRERTLCEGDGCTDNTLRVTFGDATVAGADPATFNSSLILPTPATDAEFTVTVQGDIREEGVQGWSMGVAHDPEKIEILSVTLDGLPLPEIFFETTVPAIPRPGSPGFVSAVILAIFPPLSAILPIAEDTPLVTAKYRVLVDLPAGADVFFGFSDELMPDMGPPTGTNFTISRATKKPRAVTDGVVFGIHIDPFDHFQRGDTDGDGKVNITDVTISLKNIFLGEAIFFDCDNMLDANDDGQLNTADPIAILSWLFLSGDPLPEPFRTCGLDDDNDLDCVEWTCFP